VCSGCSRGGGKALVRILSILDCSESLLIVGREVLKSVGEGGARVGVFAEWYPAIVKTYVEPYFGTCVKSLEKRLYIVYSHPH
jgi:hypothetical protein